MRSAAGYVLAFVGGVLVAAALPDVSTLRRTWLILAIWSFAVAAHLLLGES